jgi:murein DD-endopeptidase MepM/ murein hydrolase activator NlpD
VRRVLVCVGVVVLLAFSVPRAQTADALSVSIDARAERPGEVIVLGIQLPSAVESVRVHVLNRSVPAFQLSPLVWQALVGLDIDAHPGRDTVTVEAQAGDRVLRTTKTLVVQPHRFPTRTLRVDPAFVTPPAEEERRILAEAHELETLWTASAASRLWSGSFVAPVPAAASGRFGARSIFNGQLRSPHAGEDFASPAGTPVLAPNAGRVVLAKELYFAGNTVIVDHGLGLFSLLEHLSVIDVATGESIRTGQTVGRVGATGRVTGPHLHWAVRLNGARVDPLSVLATLGR